MVFVELPKFKRSLVELDTLVDKWLYFMQHAKELQDVPPAMAEVPEIDKAFKVANRTNLSLEELDELEQHEFFINDMRRLRLQAHNARAEGHAEGLRAGKTAGMKQKAIEIAQQLLDILDDEAISQKVGLSIRRNTSFAFRITEQQIFKTVSV